MERIKATIFILGIFILSNNQAYGQDKFWVKQTVLNDDILAILSYRIINDSTVKIHLTLDNLSSDTLLFSTSQYITSKGLWMNLASSEYEYAYENESEFSGDSLFNFPEIYDTLWMLPPPPSSFEKQFGDSAQVNLHCWSTFELQVQYYKNPSLLNKKYIYNDTIIIDILNNLENKKHGLSTTIELKPHLLSNLPIIYTLVKNAFDLSEFKRFHKLTITSPDPSVEIHHNSDSLYISISNHHPCTIPVNIYNSRTKELLTTRYFIPENLGNAPLEVQLDTFESDCLYKDKITEASDINIMFLHPSFHNTISVVRFTCIIMPAVGSLDMIKRNSAKIGAEFYEKILKAPVGSQFIFTDVYMKSDSSDFESRSTNGLVLKICE